MWVYKIHILSNISKENVCYHCGQPISPIQNLLTKLLEYYAPEDFEEYIHIEKPISYTNEYITFKIYDKLDTLLEKVSAFAQQQKIYAAVFMVNNSLVEAEYHVCGPTHRTVDFTFQDVLYSLQRDYGNKIVDGKRVIPVTKKIIKKKKIPTYKPTPYDVGDL